MELEDQPRPSPETILESQGYYTPESIALAQVVDGIDSRTIKKWKVEDEL